MEEEGGGGGDAEEAPDVTSCSGREAVASLSASRRQGKSCTGVAWRRCITARADSRRRAPGAESGTDVPADSGLYMQERVNVDVVRMVGFY